MTTRGLVSKLAAIVAAHKGKIAIFGMSCWGLGKIYEATSNFLWTILIALVALEVLIVAKRNLKSIIEKFEVHKDKISTIALGHTFNATFDAIFNYPLYFSVIEFFGLLDGGRIMTILSFITCLGFIKFYDWLKEDWLGLEVAKEVKDIGPSYIKNIAVDSRIGRILWWPFSKIILIVLWSLRKNKIVAFFALSVFTDPFMTTVFLRKGVNSYNGLSRKDWLVFIASTIVSNVYWSVRAYAIMWIAKFLWSVKSLVVIWTVKVFWTIRESLIVWSNEITRLIVDLF